MLFIVLFIIFAIFYIRYGLYDHFTNENKQLSKEQVRFIKGQYSDKIGINQKKYPKTYTCINAQGQKRSCNIRGAETNNPEARKLIGKTVTLDWPEKNTEYEIVTLSTGDPYKNNILSNTKPYEGKLPAFWEAIIPAGVQVTTASITLFRTLFSKIIDIPVNAVKYVLSRMLALAGKPFKYVGSKIDQGIIQPAKEKGGELLNKMKGEPKPEEPQEIELQELGELEEEDVGEDIGEDLGEGIGEEVAGDTGMSFLASIGVVGSSIGEGMAAIASSSGEIMGACTSGGPITVALCTVMLVVLGTLYIAFENGVELLRYTSTGEYCGYDSNEKGEKVVEMINSLITEISLKLKIDTFQEFIENKTNYSFVDNNLKDKSGKIYSNGSEIYQQQYEKYNKYKQNIIDKANNKKFNNNVPKTGNLYQKGVINENSLFYIRMTSIHELVNQILPKYGHEVEDKDKNQMKCLYNITKAASGGKEIENDGHFWSWKALTTWSDRGQLNRLLKNKKLYNQLKFRTVAYINNEITGVLSKFKYSVYDKERNKTRELNEDGMDSSGCYYHLYDHVDQENHHYTNFWGLADSKAPLHNVNEFCPDFRNKRGSAYNTSIQNLKEAGIIEGWQNGRGETITDDWGINETTLWNKTVGDFDSTHLHAKKYEKENLIYDYNNYIKEGATGRKLLKYYKKQIFLYIPHMSEYDSRFKQELETYFKNTGQTDLLDLNKNITYIFPTMGLSRPNINNKDNIYGPNSPLMALSNPLIGLKDTERGLNFVENKYDEYETKGYLHPLIGEETYPKNPTTQFCSPYIRQVHTRDRRKWNSSGHGDAAQAEIYPEWAANGSIGVSKDDDGMDSCMDYLKYGKEDVLLTTGLKYNFGMLIYEQEGNIERDPLNKIKDLDINEVINLQLGLDKSYWDTIGKSKIKYNKDIGCKFTNKISDYKCPPKSQMNCDYCIVKNVSVFTRGEQSSNYITISELDFNKLMKQKIYTRIVDNKKKKMVQNKFIPNLWSFEFSNEQYNIINQSKEKNNTRKLTVDKILKQGIEQDTAFVSNIFNQDICFKNSLKKEDLGNIYNETREDSLTKIKDNQEWSKKKAVYNCYNTIVNSMDNKTRKEVVPKNEMRPLKENIREYAITKDTTGSCKWVQEKIQRNVKYEVKESDINDLEKCYFENPCSRYPILCNISVPGVYINLMNNKGTDIPKIYSITTENLKETLDIKNMELQNYYTPIYVRKKGVMKNLPDKFPKYIYDSNSDFGVYKDYYINFMKAPPFFKNRHKLLDIRWAMGHKVAYYTYFDKSTFVTKRIVYSNGEWKEGDMKGLLNKNTISCYKLKDKINILENYNLKYVLNKTGRDYHTLYKMASKYQKPTLLDLQRVFNNSKTSMYKMWYSKLSDMQKLLIKPSGQCYRTMKSAEQGIKTGQELLFKQLKTKVNEQKSVKNIEIKGTFELDETKIKSTAKLLNPSEKMKLLDSYEKCSNEINKYIV